MKIQTMKTFIANNYPDSSTGMVESILREKGFYLTTQNVERAAPKHVKPKDLALQAVMEFEGLAPDLEGITQIIYYLVPETEKYFATIVCFYQKKNL